MKPTILALTAAIALLGEFSVDMTTANAAALEDLTPNSAVKLPAREVGPMQFEELDNSIGGTATAGPVPEAVTRSGCIRSGGRVRIGVSLFGTGRFNFVTTPDRFFDVVMTVNLPGYNERVDGFFEGGVERTTVRKNVSRRLDGTVVISGFRGSSGCFRFRLTP